MFRFELIIIRLTRGIIDGLKGENNNGFVQLYKENFGMLNRFVTNNNGSTNNRLRCAFVETFYLINLKSVMEGGLDLRNKDPELKGVVNN